MPLLSFCLERSRLLALTACALAGMACFNCTRSIAQTNLPAANPLAGPSSPLSPRFFGLTTLEYKRYQAGLPYHIARTWDAYPGLGWPEINPVKGRYDFHGLDEYLAQFGTHDREIIYTFGRVPRWASTRPDVAGAYTPGECAPPDLAAWDAFVSALVRHANGRIRYWELWNEPDQPRFYCGDIPSLVTVAQHASAIIRRLDPKAVILSPAATGGDGAGWLTKFIVAGGRGTFDAVAFHGYEGIYAEAILPIVAVYRNTLHATNLPDLPLVDTECSWGSNPIGDDAQRAAFVAKDFILQWSAHVSRVLWYAYDAEPKWGRLVDDKGSLLPDGIAYRETYNWIVGASLTGPCAKDAQNTWTCELTRTGGYRAQIVWNSATTRPVRFPVAAPLTAYRDLEGKRIRVENGAVSVGNMPILIESGAPSR